jgi:nucleoside 2-deoxyribosyltransferase
MSKTCFLSGPITGLSYDGATGWREYVSKALEHYGIESLSPMRCGEFLKSEHAIQDHYEHILATKRAIKVRDRFDVQRCDALFVNLLGAKKVSIGTVLEIAWADAWQKPIILCMEQDNLHKHAMIEEMAGFITDNLDEGIWVARALLVA